MRRTIYPGISLICLPKVGLFLVVVVATLTGVTGTSTCSPNPCNDGVCIPPSTAHGEVTCQCDLEHLGTYCEYTNPCYNNFCQNDGVCVVEYSTDGRPPSFECNCTLGYDGSLCEWEKDSVCTIEQPCQNGGSCRLTTSLWEYECDCTPAKTGVNCTEENHCFSNPCLNGAYCISSSTGYECDCAEGFEGASCETDINECTRPNGPTVCFNGGTCHNLFGGFSCECPRDFTGDQCASAYEPCSPDPCQNGGQCASTGPYTFTCTCLSGFSGDTCEINLNDCTQHMCLNGGRCVDGVNNYTCLCPPEYEGKYCQHDVDECDTPINPCFNGATCQNTIGNFSCVCVSGYEGRYCEINHDDCNPNPCQLGNCTDGVSTFTCTCPPGKTGLLCHLEDACLSNPCHHTAVCTTSPTDGGYVCSCATGYEGYNCSVDIDECSLSLTPICGPEGRCHNFEGGYECLCNPGLTGERCESDIDECMDDPCRNGGTCYNRRGSYQCVCLLGMSSTSFF